MNIPDEAVQAAYDKFQHLGLNASDIEGILEAAAPHILAACEQALADAKRAIALLVLEAGGEVAIGHRAIAELSDKTVIETTQDVIDGGWVIRARNPQP